MFRDCSLCDVCVCFVVLNVLPSIDGSVDLGTGFFRFLAVGSFPLCVKSRFLSDLFEAESWTLSINTKSLKFSDDKEGMKTTEWGSKNLRWPAKSECGSPLSIFLVSISIKLRCIIISSRFQ